MSWVRIESEYFVYLSCVYIYVRLIMSSYLSFKKKIIMTHVPDMNFAFQDIEHE